MRSADTRKPSSGQPMTLQDANRVTFSGLLASARGSAHLGHRERGRIEQGLDAKTGLSPDEAPGDYTMADAMRRLPCPLRLATVSAGRHKVGGRRPYPAQPQSRFGAEANGAADRPNGTTSWLTPRHVCAARRARKPVSQSPEHRDANAGGGQPRTVC